MNTTETAAMAKDLQDAWPGIPDGMEYALKLNWDALQDRIRAHDAGVSTEDDHPINDFTVRLATMAAAAGFQHDSQAKEFIGAAMHAAGIPENLRNTVAVTFAVQLAAITA